MATLKQVAAEAGVSVSIASRILSPNPEPSGRYSQDTRKRVEVAAKKLGYRPNRYAEFLKRGENPSIGVFMPECSNRLIADLVMGLSQAAAANFFPLALHFSLSFERYRDFLKANEKNKFCGIITYPGFREDAETKRLVEDFRAKGGRLLLLNSDITVRGVPVVALNDHYGGHLAAARLIERNCAEYVLLGDFPGRNEGFLDTLAKNGRKKIRRLPHDEWVNYLPKIVDRATAEKPLGIFAVNDLLALRITRFLHARKIAVGRDALVVGYDNLAATEECYPPLTTIHQPFLEEGKIALEKMINIIYGKEEGDVYIQPRIVIRESA